MFKLFLVVCFCLLQACGSGGTPATLGQINFTEGGPYIPFVAMNTGLMSTQVTDADPNKSVSTSSSTYDLRWSTPDNSGPGYANAYFYGSWKPTAHLKLWGQTLTASCSSKDYSSCAPASYEIPHEDVITAFHQGWTGKGVNILIEDYLSGENTYHGINTGLIASRNAPGANLYGLDLSSSETVIDNQLGARPTGGYRYAPGANYYGLNIVRNPFANEVFFNQLDSSQSATDGRNIKLGVVNQSYTANMSALIRRDQSTSPWTTDELSRARIAYTGSQVSTINRMKDEGLRGHSSLYSGISTLMKRAHV